MKIKLHAETKIPNYSTLDKLNAIMKFKNMVNLEPKRYYLQIYNFFIIVWSKRIFVKRLSL